LLILVHIYSKLVIEQIRETAIERKSEQDGKMISLEATHASDLRCLPNIINKTIHQ